MFSESKCNGVCNKGKGFFFSILFFKSILQICLLAGEFNPFKVIIGREGLSDVILLIVFGMSYRFFVPRFLPASIYKYLKKSKYK